MDLMDILSQGIDLTLWIGIAVAGSVIAGAVVAVMVMLGVITGIKKIMDTKEDHRDHVSDELGADETVEESVEKEKELVG